MIYFLQQLLNGLHSAAIYALLAFGYVLTNSVLHRTNLAHGPLFAFAGQTAILVAVWGWQVLWLTLPATVSLGIVAAFAYAGLAGWVLARSVLGPLAERSPNAIVIATLGVAIALVELARIAAGTRDFWLPPMLADPVVIAFDGRSGATLTVIQLLNCAVALAALALGALVLARSRFGRALRAVSDDPQAASMCGVDASKIFLAAVLGGALAAALAGVMAAVYYGNISFGTGMVYGLKVLFLVAAGGLRSPIHAAAGAACFGMAEALWAGYFPIEWRDAWMFGALVVLLVLRPAAQERRPI